MKLTVALLVVMVVLMVQMQTGSRVQAIIKVSTNLFDFLHAIGTDTLAGFGDEFWKRKVRTFFAVLDTDHDGKLVEDDYGDLADRYSEIAKFDEVEGKRINRKLRGIFQQYHGELIKNGPLTVEGFVESIKEKGQVENVKTTVQWFGLFFDLMDIKGDGVINKEAYAHFCNAFQLSPAVAELSFKAVDVNNIGLIVFDDYLKAALAYMTDSDTKSPHNLFWGPLQN